MGRVVAPVPLRAYRRRLLVRWDWKTFTSLGETEPIVSAARIIPAGIGSTSPLDSRGSSVLPPLNRADGRGAGPPMRRGTI